MKKTILSAFLLSALVFLAFTSIEAQSLTTNKSALEKLSGTYADEVAVDWGRGTFGQRTFTFNKGMWTLRFVLALDKEMKQQVFVFRTTGSYKVLEASTAVPNAFNALFLEDKKWVTLKTGDENLAKAFGLAECGLKLDVEKDISISGCGLWKPVAICNQDHDLLSLDEKGNLYFGLRPNDNDMCDANKRPTKLYLPVKKI